MAQAPQRRYAMHVIRYKTKAGTFDLITPYSIEVLVWSFTDKIFNQIADAANEWGDLRKHDLILGPCTNETFQQFDLSVGSKAAWLEDAQRKDLTATAFRENQIEDLAIACGSKKEKRWIEEDLNKIREAWSQINGANTSAVDDGSLDDDLNDLLGAKTPAATTAPAAPKDEVDLSTATDLTDLLGETETPATEAVAEPVEVAAAPSADNFDDLLADLG